jgi:hypothetical protein
MEISPNLLALETQVGNPKAKWDSLINHIQSEGVTRFAEIESSWLELLWCLDCYRVAGVAPRGLGKPSLSEPRRLAAAYRMKGNWFALAVAALLQNRTSQPIGAKNRVIGFSQPHQIDVAWPPRENDPLVCIETKVTGAPGFGDTPARGAMADFSNRRKELKFAATDLKLYRRQDGTTIDHWGAWRSAAPPKTYFLWGARLRTGARNADSVVQLATETQALVNTYLDGAGVLAWRENASADGYDAVELPQWAAVSKLDDVLHRVASEIKQMAPAGVVPEAVVPRTAAIDTDQLLQDSDIDPSA